MAACVGAMPKVTSVSGWLLGHFESLGDDLLEAIDGADEMVGREDGDHRVRVVLGDHGRAETDGVDRVAAGRLAEELFLGQPGDGVEDHAGRASRRRR